MATPRDNGQASDSQDRASSSGSSSRQYIPITRTDSTQASEQNVHHSPPRPIESQPRNTYGTMGPTTDQPGYRSGPGSYDASRSPILGPQDRTPKKPAIIRRVSSKPYRGQEFSVDDDIDEFVGDKSIKQASSSARSSGRPNTLRRRSLARPSILHRMEFGDDPPDISPPTEPTSRYLEESQLSTHDEDEEDDDPIDGGDDDDHNGNNNENDDDDEDDGSVVSDAESFTLKDRQQAINQTHPFGIRIWKPALYKKLRSVEKNAEGDIHSVPGERVSKSLALANLLWSLIFGWWLALAAFIGAVACFACGGFSDGAAYGQIFWELSGYLLYPFGSFVRLETDENYAHEDEGDGRSISEYEQWQSGDLEHGRLFFGPIGNRSLVGRRRNSIDSAGEHESLLGRTGRPHPDEAVYTIKRRYFGRGEWTIGRVIFYAYFYLVVGPLLLFQSLICWILVFWIPMARVSHILFHHLRRHPLALSFCSDTTLRRLPSSNSSILLCTYRAAGLKYWKYTVDGTNIILINMLAVVVFVIADYFLLKKTLLIDNAITHPGFIFLLALLAIIPLAYFIGQAVASISAQSSMGLGAAINAFFSTIVEVYLYCVALSEGKAQLVEGSIIGSIFAGILFLPGLSMCFGAILRKTQRFNVKSAGVTSTMLLFAVVAAFGPTLFYQIYGSHELNCHSCTNPDASGGRDCRRCYFSQVPALNDKFFLKAVQPYSWFAAFLLFLSYIIGLWFTLRTHAAIIWSTDADEKKLHVSHHSSDALANFHAKNPSHLGNSMPHKGSVRESQLYARILGQSLKQVGLAPQDEEINPVQNPGQPQPAESTTPHLVPPKDKHKPHTPPSMSVPGLTAQQNEDLVRRVTEVAATAATVAARDAARPTKKPTGGASVGGTPGSKTPVAAPLGHTEEVDEATMFTEHNGSSDGHDAPNWSKTKSSVILLGSTFLYAIIAEILVNTVDVVLESFDIDEKFLGITLFALVPNTTEFLNAISFAMNGNIALSMEIGSAYALQVCLLQIPAVVLYSAIHSSFVDPAELIDHSFNLIFPQWDMVTVILCVFLLSYVYGEGKSNYFKGSILLLTYLFVIMGFYLSSFNTMQSMGVDMHDTLALGVVKNSDGSFSVRDRS
ncbi:hypothetical protein FQN57_000448 [Myotisia sp. PD_48]|nr:hypothetical protein FQN57_000448 [Myotisia sp. PD_48]